MLKVQSWPLSFNRHLTTLDELKNLYWSRNAGGWDSSVTGPETMTLIVKRWNNCPNYALMCLLQGLGLNQQELEMQSILVRVLQVCKIALLLTSSLWSTVHCPNLLEKFGLPCSSVSLQEFLEAAVYTKQQQDTNLQEQSQVGIIFRTIMQVSL